MRPVCLVPNRQVRRAFGVEDEERAEHERERRGLEVVAHGIVCRVEPFALGPPAELQAERREDVLPNRLVEPLAEFRSEVACFAEKRREPVMCEVVGCKEAQQRPVVIAEGSCVQLEVARDGRAALRRRLE